MNSFGTARQKKTRGKLPAKGRSSTIDPSFLVKRQSLAKGYLFNYLRRPFCRELFSASSETFLDSTERAETKKNSKYRQNVKEPFFRIFMVHP